MVVFIPHWLLCSLTSAFKTANIHVTENKYLVAEDLQRLELMRTHFTHLLSSVVQWGNSIIPNKTVFQMPKKIEEVGKNNISQPALDPSACTFCYSVR